MPAGSSDRSRDRRVEVAPIENEVVPDDEADLGRAQEGTGIAELCRIADAAGVGILRALLHQFVDRPVGCARRFLEAAAQPVGEERPGQDVVDDDVVPGDLSRQAGDEAGQACARAVAASVEIVTSTNIATNKVSNNVPLRFVVIWNLLPAG